MEYITLSNDVIMPLLGLGTYEAIDGYAKNAVKAALSNGYRLIDTASYYNNEKEIGEAIKESGISRNEIFITTKLWNTDQGYESTKKAFYDSLEKLDCGYIDLYLIHWPKPFGYEDAINSWRAMEELYEEGKIRAIGIANFQIHHIDNLLKHCRIKPMVNQVECHVNLPQYVLHEYCKSHGIYLMAYAPLMKGQIFENEILNNIARKYNKSTANIAVRWLIEREIIAIPKSINTKRISDNCKIYDFELNKDDKDKIKTISRGRRIYADPDNIYF